MPGWVLAGHAGVEPRGGSGPYHDDVARATPRAAPCNHSLRTGYASNRQGLLFSSGDTLMMGAKDGG